MNEILESRIDGEADVIFGGKIGACTNSLKIEQPNRVLRIGELNENLGIGTWNNNINESSFKEGFQVNLVFTNPDSIDVVIDWLKETKKELNDKLKEVKDYERV